MDKRTSMCIWLIGIIAMRLVEPDGIDFATRGEVFCAALIACAGAYWLGRTSGAPSPRS